jgi:hypothetical protein
MNFVRALLVCKSGIHLLDIDAAQLTLRVMW